MNHELEEIKRDEKRAWAGFKRCNTWADRWIGRDEKKVAHYRAWGEVFKASAIKAAEKAKAFQA